MRTRLKGWALAAATAPALLFTTMPAAAGTFVFDWAAATWPSGNLGPRTYTFTDENGFQLDFRIGITGINGSFVGGFPAVDTAATGQFGTNDDLGIAFAPLAGRGGIGEATVTSQLQLLTGATLVPADGLSFRVTDIDASDNNAANDRCDFITATGNSGNPTLSAVTSTPAFLLGPGPGAGSTPPLAANQAQCNYLFGPAVSPASFGDDNGSVLVDYPAGTHTATIQYDESIENVYGVTSRSPAARGTATFDLITAVVNNSISLEKTTTATSFTGPRDTITYTFTITNNGPLPINTGQDIVIDDDKIGEFTCGTITAPIPAGGTHSCAADYVATSADANLGLITNTATAGVGTPGQPFGDRLQSNSDVVSVPHVPVGSTAFIAGTTAACQGTLTAVGTNVLGSGGYAGSNLASFANAGGSGVDITVQKLSGLDSRTPAGASAPLYSIPGTATVAGVWLGSDDNFPAKVVNEALDREEYRVSFSEGLDQVELTFAALNWNADGDERVAITGVFDTSGVNITSSTVLQFFDQTPGGSGDLVFDYGSGHIIGNFFQNTDFSGTCCNSNARIRLDAPSEIGSVTFTRYEEDNEAASFKLYPNANRSNGVTLGPIAMCQNQQDFSDAPLTTTSYGSASHALTAGGPTLGAAVTADATDYDDANAVGDVDDGVALPAFTQGQTAVIPVSVTGAGGRLQAWIDFDGNGAFDAGEQVATDLQDGGAQDQDGTVDGTITLAVDVPWTATYDQTFARFRWSTDAALGASGPASDGEVEDYALTVVPAVPSLALVKSVTAVEDSNGNGVTDAGDTVRFGFDVTNTGETALAGIVVSDTGLAGVTAVMSAGFDGDLAIGETAAGVATAAYVLTAADVAAGGIENLAEAVSTPVATGAGGVPDPATVLVDPATGVEYVAGAVRDVSDAGTAADGTPVGTPETEETPDLDTVGGDGNDADPGNDPTPLALVPPVPSLALVKSVTAVEDSNGDLVLGNAGDTVVYAFTVQNTGETALADIAITDAGLPDVTLVPEPAFDGDLAVGEGPVVAATGTYMITEDDIVAGEIVNSATVTSQAVETGSTGDPLPGSPYALPPVTDVSDTASEPELDQNGDVIGIVDPLTTNSDGVAGNDADEPTVLIVPARPSDLVLSGTVFFDVNGDGFLGSSDDPTAGAEFTAQLVNSDGEIIATQETDANGFYEFTGFPAGTYTVVFIDDDGMAIGQSTPVTLDAANREVRDVDQPIDPSGVIYDAVTGDPVSGVLVELTDALGVPVPASCLLPGQQSQVTGADGAYRFDVVTDPANPACPDTETEYRVSITSVPADYQPGTSGLIPPESGALDATTCALDAVPGGACQLSASTLAPAPSAPTPYFLAFLLQNGDPNVVNNHIPLDPVARAPIPGLAVEKTVDLARTDVRIGDSVPYTILVRNNDPVAVTPAVIVDELPVGLVYTPDSLTVDGVSVAPEVAGRVLRVPGQTIPANGTVELKLVARVGANAPVGELVNQAYVTDTNGDIVSNVATATVVRTPEAVFDCTDIIGKVFDDKNGNGYQDGPQTALILNDNALGGAKFAPPRETAKTEEPGIPGVRLATADGTLIKTDEFGRYHIPCAALPEKIGSNFILKLDTRTLPSGYRVTTENPRVVRVTPGKITKLNFGASISRVIDIDLTAAAFGDGDELSQELVQGVSALLERIKDKPSVLRVAYFHADADKSQARSRLDAVERLVRQLWRQDGRYKLNIERTIKRMQ